MYTPRKVEAELIFIFRPRIVNPRETGSNAMENPPT